MKEHTHFYTAMYLRLSRDDKTVPDNGAVLDDGNPGEVAGKSGEFKVESNSIGSQRNMIRSFVREQADMELYDIYVDDGFSGSNYDRPEFKRMMSDIEAGKVNCVVVKDLSRFGRDYIETGRYLERVFPALGVRFIALTDHYDSFSADWGERTIVLPVKNFINDSYCRDISVKVKSQLAAKRKAGECLVPFAVYGYLKSTEEKNKLAVDDYAAGVVRKIFYWKIEGMSIAAIANRLNSLQILPPKEYKQSKGLNYNGGFQGSTGKGWSGVAVKRILTNETYLGHLLQGKTEKINYKVKKNVEKPREEWVRVENTHDAIVSASDFQIVQHLLKSDGRVSPESGEVNPFAGLLFCGDCGEQMVRRIVRYGSSKKVYYICSTKNRGDGCSRHSIEENILKELVLTAVRGYANRFLMQEKLFEQLRGPEVKFGRSALPDSLSVQCHGQVCEMQGRNFKSLTGINNEVARLKQEQEKFDCLRSGLYEDLRRGVITQEEFERFYREFSQKSENLEQARKEQERLISDMLRKGAACAGRLAVFRDSLELKEIDRHTLTSMVKRIMIFEGKRIELEFSFYDQYHAMQECTAILGRHKADGERSV